MRQIAQAAEPSADQRQYERVSTGLLGKLFVPAENLTIDCRVLNLSAGGASVKCNEPPSLHTFVVLYVDGFGRFEGTALRFTEGELGLKFDCKDAKRQRLVYALNAFVRDGSTTNTRLRGHPRMSAGSDLPFYPRQWRTAVVRGNRHILAGRIVAHYFPAGRWGTD